MQEVRGSWDGTTHNSTSRFRGRMNRHTNPAFGANTTGYTSVGTAGGSVSRVTLGVEPAGATACGRIIASTSGDHAFSMVPVTNAEFTTAGYVVGETYTWSTYARFYDGPSSAHGAHLQVRFYDSVGGHLSTAFGDVVVITRASSLTDPDAWVRLWVTAPIPASAARVEMVPILFSVVATEQFHVTAALIENATIPRLYFDGNTVIDTDPAIVSAERNMRARIAVDWNRDGNFDHPLSDLTPYADDIVTDRALRGHAPDELLLIEGSSAAELSFSVAGAYQDLSFVGVFSPYNSRSPFYGEDVIGAEIRYEIEVDTEIGPVAFPQFVGTIRTISPDHETGEVEITALDRAELLRRPVLTPNWAVSSYHESRGALATQLATSDSYIDHFLRLCGVSQTPYRPRLPEESLDNQVLPTTEGVKFWLNGSGSVVPTIGWLYRPEILQYPLDSAGLDMYDEVGLVHPDSPDQSHRPRCLAALGGTGSDTFAFNVSSNTNLAQQNYYMGFTLSMGGQNGTYWQTAPDHYIFAVRVRPFYVLRIGVGNGQVWAEAVNLDSSAVVASTRLTIPTGQLAVPVAVQWEQPPANPSQPKVHITAGSATLALQTLASITRSSLADPELGAVSLAHPVGVSDFYFAHKNWAHPAAINPTEGRMPAEYVAVLDRGLNQMSFTPNEHVNDAWSEVGKVAAAEFGSVFWDESGVFYFWNFDTIEGKRTEIVREFTLDQVSGLKMTNTLDSIRNFWSAAVPRRRAVDMKIYDSSSVDDFYLGPLGVTTVTRPPDEVTQTVYPLSLTRCSTLGGGPYIPWGDDVVHGFVVQFYSGGVWAENDALGGILFEPDRDAYGNIVFQYANPTALPIRFATNAGNPACRTFGTAIVDQGDQTLVYMDQDSRDTYGPKNMPFGGDYVQDEGTVAELIGDRLLPRTVDPTPATDAIEIAGDPRLQLGDTIRVTDPDGLGAEIDLQIYGIRRRYSKSEGLRETLTVEMIRPVI